MNQKLEDMTTEELIKFIVKSYKELGLQLRKLDAAPNGTILLDPNNESDREWYENDEEYGGYE